MGLPINEVLYGDAIDIMRARIPDDSIDLVVTSPPYWGLRDYGSETVRVWGGAQECGHEWVEDSTKFTRGDQSGLPKYIRADTGKPTGGAKKHPQIKEDLEKVNPSDFCAKCGAWRGSLGLEPHPQMFIDHLVEICREIKRVLKPTGTFWLNLGDTYYGSGKGVGTPLENAKEVYIMKKPSKPKQNYRSNWLQPKQKLMIPARVAIALQHDGWILRNDLIWYKPNHMPSSVKDRLTCAYEHVFLFAKARRYYFDLDAIRKPHTSDGEYRNKLRAGKEKYTGKGAWSIHEFGSTSVFNMGSSLHPKGKNPGDVWDINKPLISDSRKELHGPTYRRHQMRIEGGQAIGMNQLGKNPGDLWNIPTKPFPAAHFATFPPALIEPIVKAGCPEKGVVLDPFCGSGTALRVARRLGRRFIGIDIVPEYVEMAQRRIRGDRYREPPEGVTPLDVRDKKV